MEKDKKIGLIGHVDSGTMILSARGKTHENENKVIVVDTDNSPKNTIEINGTHYEQIVKKQPTLSRGAHRMIMIAAVLGSFGEVGNNYTRQLPPGTDIVKEYGLIQLKKSTLSRHDRDTVVHIFESNFKPITTPWPQQG